MPAVVMLMAPRLGVGGSCVASIQNLGDVHELDRQADPLGAAPLMHQAGAVVRHDVFCPGPGRGRSPCHSRARRQGRFRSKGLVPGGRKKPSCAFEGAPADRLAGSLLPARLRPQSF